jgi:hypothetical protein
LTEDEYFCTEDGARGGVTFENTSQTEPLVMLRYFGPDVNPDAPEVGAHNKALNMSMPRKGTGDGRARLSQGGRAATKQKVEAERL